ncbi:fungal-specific transcription factor domain-containing protein [Ilyonectria sp. MPI-CAGE-AT-0026]|nr:fungal-specific transcription factor domain-containing protein [Ilyonectria sp. MPI-CAGE-AT-0026]
MNGTRSRTGCWTCRKRHQKCDEAKPSCGNCRLRGAECGGYGIRLTDFMACNGLDGQMVSKATRGSPAQNGRGKPQRKSRLRGSGHASLTKSKKPHSFGDDTTHGIDSSFKPKTPKDTDQCTIVFVHEQGFPPAKASPKTQHLAARDTQDPNVPIESLQETAAPENDTDFMMTDSYTATSSLPHTTDSLLHGLSSHELNTDIGRLWQGFADPSGSNEETPFLESMELSLSPFAKGPSLLGLSCFTQSSSDSQGSPTSIDDVESSFGEDEVADEEIVAEETIDGFISESLVTTQPSTPFDQHLFSHFVNNLALRLYPVEPDRNPYRAVYCSLAKESKPLLNSILFASALHLTKLGQLPNYVIKTYRTALKDSFRDALQSDNEAWGLGATVLLSVIFDVIGTGMDTWSSKLIGCRRLLVLGLAKSRGRIGPAMKCVLQQFNWMVTMGRTLLIGYQSPASFDELKCICGVPALDQVFEDADMASQQDHWWANSPDFRMHLFLREATDLSAAVNRLKTAEDSNLELLQLMPQVGELVNKIHHWEPDVSSVTSDYLSSATHFNELWRNGMLCFVYHDVYSLDSSNQRIQECVEGSLESFKRLSWLQACLWPVFMIAVHARSAESRTCFETGLMNMHTTLGFTSPLSLVLILKKIWEQSDYDITGAARWKGIVKELGMELNILL